MTSIPLSKSLKKPTNTIQNQLLVIDDDDLILQSIRIALPSQWRMVGINSLKELPKNTKFDAALVDMHLTGDLSNPQGLDAVKFLNKNNSHLEIIAMSGDLNRSLMEDCLKSGASRFMAKPLSADELLLTLEKIEALILLKQACLRKGSHGPRWIGSGKSTQAIQQAVSRLKGENGPILIEGASGSGKEVVANLIHQQEGAERPFISVNVAAIPDNLFESELFGHVKGAFTGADQNKMGLIEAAHNGDLFLDEIEALNSAHQAKLLRFLETFELRRVGAKTITKIDVRVIVATNKSLEQMVKDNEFREDLLWRLNGKKIILSPLKDRKEDIGEIAQHFIDKEKPRHNKELDEQAIEALKNYDWPGNVRELRRACEQLCLTSPLPFIRKEDIDRLLSSNQPYSSNQGVDFNNRKVDLEKGLSHIIGKFEAQVIHQTLADEPDIDATAKLLQISRSNLYKKIKDYNINV